MIFRHVTITLAMLQGLIMIGFLLLFVILVRDAQMASVRDGTNSLGLPEWLWLSSLLGVSLSSAATAYLVLSPFARTTLALAVVQLASSVILLITLRTQPLILAAVGLAAVSTLTMLASLYRQRSQRHEDSSQLIGLRTALPSVPTKRQSRLANIFLITIQCLLALSLAIYGLVGTGSIAGYGTIAYEPSALIILTCAFSLSLLSLAIGILLTTRHASVITHLAAVQSLLLLPLALMFLMISSVPLVRLIGFLIICPPAATIITSVLRQGEAGERNPPPYKTRTLSRMGNEQANPPTRRSPIYHAFQIARFLVAGTQIVFAISLAILCYRKPQIHATLQQAFADVFYRELTLHSFVALALGCLLLTPWTRVTIIFGLLQIAVVLSRSTVDESFYLSQLLVPLAIASVALSIWRERLAPPSLAD